MIPDHKPVYRMKLWMVWVGLALWIGLGSLLVWLIQG